MTGTRILLAAAACGWIAFAPLSGFPQEGEATLIDDLTPEFRASQVYSQQAVDLEILSTIVHEDVGQLFTPHLEAHRDSTTSSIAAALGDVIPGFGVVVQLKTPPLRQAAAGTKPDKLEMTRWERTRLMLQGDTVHPAEIARMFKGQTLDCVRCHMPTRELRRAVVASAPTRSELVKQLIDTLAENGRHFRGLKPEEQIVITIACDGGTAPKNAHRISGWESKNFVDQFVLKQITTREPLISSQDDDSAAVKRANDGHKASKSTQELTGDLFAKQGQHQKAIDAYRRAMDHWERSPQDDLTGAQRGLVQKLVRAYMSAGREEEAMKVASDLFGLDQFTETLKDGDDVRTKQLEFLRRIYLDLTGLPPSRRRRQGVSRGR